MFGALNGLGAMATRAYGDGLRALLGRSGMHTYLQSQAVRWAATVLTLHYVCFCNLFFSSDVRHALALLSAAAATLAHLPALLARYAWQPREFLLLGAAALALAVLWKAEMIARLAAQLATSIAGRPFLLYTVVWVQILIVVSFYFVDWAFKHQPPPILYGAF